MQKKYYYANGICSNTKNSPNIFCIEEFNVQTDEVIVTNYAFDEDQILYEIQNTIVNVDNMLKCKIFGDLDVFYENMNVSPMYLSSCGLGAELMLSKDDLIELCKEHSDLYNKYMYYYDCCSILDSIMNNIIISKHKFINFYKELVKIDIISIGNEENSEMIVSGEKIIALFSYIEGVFISLYSTFDLITKIAIEIENIPQNFKLYPKMKSAKMLFGDKKKIQGIDFQGTIFEKRSSTNFIENMRNVLIHNGSWQNINRVYLNIKNGKIVDRYIYMPDINGDGHLYKYKNRYRFYSGEKKINLEMPRVYLETLFLINNTLFKLHYKREESIEFMDERGKELYEKYHNI